MKHFTKWLSSVLAAIMLLSLLPMAAFATEADGNPETSSKKTAITVTVTDAQDATKKLSGCGIKLERVTSGRYEDYGIQYTGAGGATTFGSLEPGWYRITQVSVAEGYKQNSYPYVAWFGDEENMHNVSFQNYSQRSLTIKRVSNGKDPVANVPYSVKDTNGSIIYSGKTDANGILYFPYIAPGDYTIEEESQPNGIDPPSWNPQPLHVPQVDNGGDYLVLFNSSKQPSLIIYYLERETHLGIPGVMFNLYKANGELVESNIRTDSAGMAIVTNLEAGDYILRQTYMPDGYVNKLQEAEFKVKVSADGNIVETFYGDRLGTVTILVADSETGQPIPGATVTLYSQENAIAGGPSLTDGGGKVTFTGLKPGNYTAVVKAPNGYVMDATVMSVVVSANNDVTQVFTATKSGGLSIYLEDEDGRPLSGTFTVRAQNGNKVGSYQTGSDGHVLVPELDDGYYIVEQDTAPAGYVMTNATQTVRVVAGRIAEVTFVNRARPFIVVRGYVSGSTAVVPGATYEVWDVSNKLLQSVTAGSDGTVIFEDLTPGTYVVRCVNVPNGYTLVTAAQTVTVTAKVAGLATFLFDKHSSIIVTARDSRTGEPLVGAVFQIRSESGTVIEQITTGADGCAVSKTLTPGKYIVQEYWAPNGYVCDNYFQTVMVENNTTSLMTFTHSQKSVITIYATDSKARGLVGIKFSIYDGITGVEVATLVTDEAGVATSAPLAPGVYTVKELAAPEGFLLTTSYQTPVVLYGGQASYVRFPHVTKDTILIETIDITTREAIGNAQYSVTNMNGDLIGNYSADGSGTVEVGPLKPGFYLVKQITAPEGYRICTESQTIEVISGRVLNCRFANYRLSGIAIEARDQSTHQALANVTFEIYDDDNKQVFHGTTDASGYLTSGDLPAGKYTIKQLSVPDGYTAVETTKIVTVSYNELTTVVFEQKASTSLVIELVDDENKNALSGGEFKIQDIDGNLITTAITDEGGAAIVTGLPAGKYMVTQTKAPDGYILEGNYQWAEMKVGVEKTYLKFTNNRISGLTIRALDRNTNAPLAGVTFDIYEENGKLVQTVTTDVTGIVVVTSLAAGDYLVKEMKGPEGYQVDTPTQKVTITKNANSTLTFNHVANADVTLKAVSATSGDVLAGVTFVVTTANGTYVGEYTTGANGLVQLPSIEPGDYSVTITKVPDGYLLDSTARTITVKTDVMVMETFSINQQAGLSIHVMEAQTGVGVKDVTVKITTLDGTLVGNYTSNAMGFINVDLAPGEYVVYQTYVPGEYPIDTKPYNVTIRANVLTEMEMFLAKESHIRVQVVDAASGVGVYNVEIEILMENNNFVGRYRTDNEGYIYLDQVLASGRYKLNMLSVPDGYIKDTVTKTVTVELTGTTDIKWPIAGQQGQLTITTLSASDNTLMGIHKGSRLSGAIYNITDMSGAVVATIYGDSYGEAHSGALGIGTYYVQQTQAPAGYMVNSQRVTVNISSTNNDVKITVYNESGNFATSIEAHGPRTVAAGQLAKFYWTNIYNKSTVSVGNFFVHIKVPTDGGRAATFYTGTWNGIAVTYYIEYKTNMRDYTVLASGLNSKSQYSYDLSSLSMGLSSGEYVTDIRVVFPVVPAGFHESMAPTLYVSVLPNVVNGYQLINRAEAGCQGSVAASGSVTGSASSSASGAAANTGVSSISDGWASSSSQSNTIVSGGAAAYPGYPWYPGNPFYPGYPTYPSTLPKTGY